MKTLKFIKPFLIIMLILLAVLSSCKKDESLSAGNVKIIFTNHPVDLIVNISPVENSQIAITDWLNPDKTGTCTKNLNAGNYILTCSSSTFFPNIGFQVQEGKTTVIIYDSLNAGHVQ